MIENQDIVILDVESGNKKLEHALKWLKKSAYDYVMDNMDMTYNSFFEYLYEETEQRSNLSYYFLRRMFELNHEYENSILSDLVHIMVIGLEYTALYNNYILDDIIPDILMTPQLLQYHERVKQLNKNYIIAKGNYTHNLDSNHNYENVEKIRLLCKDLPELYEYITN